MEALEAFRQALQDENDSDEEIYTSEEDDMGIFFFVCPLFAKKNGPPVTRVTRDIRKTF